MPEKKKTGPKPKAPSDKYSARLITFPPGVADRLDRDIPKGKQSAFVSEATRKALDEQDALAVRMREAARDAQWDAAAEEAREHYATDPEVKAWQGIPAPFVEDAGE